MAWSAPLLQDIDRLLEGGVTGFMTPCVIDSLEMVKIKDDDG
jgi:hypothetical protein